MHCYRCSYAEITKSCRVDSPTNYDNNKIINFVNPCNHKITMSLGLSNCCLRSTNFNSRYISPCCMLCKRNHALVRHFALMGFSCWLVFGLTGFCSVGPSFVLTGFLSDAPKSTELPPTSNQLLLVAHPILQNWWKFVHSVLSYPADRQTNRHTKAQNITSVWWK